MKYIFTTVTQNITELYFDFVFDYFLTLSIYKCPLRENLMCCKAPMGSLDHGVEYSLCTAHLAYNIISFIIKKYPKVNEKI